VTLTIETDFSSLTAMMPLAVLAKVLEVATSSMGDSHEFVRAGSMNVLLLADSFITHDFPVVTTSSLQDEIGRWGSQVSPGAFLLVEASVVELVDLAATRESNTVSIDALATKHAADLLQLNSSTFSIGLFGTDLSHYTNLLIMEGFNWTSESAFAVDRLAVISIASSGSGATVSPRGLGGEFLCSATTSDSDCFHWADLLAMFLMWLAVSINTFDNPITVSSLPYADTNLYHSTTMFLLNQNTLTNRGAFVIILLATVYLSFGILQAVLTRHTSESFLTPLQSSARLQYFRDNFLGNHQRTSPETFETNFLALWSSAAIYPSAAMLSSPCLHVFLHTTLLPVNINHERTSPLTVLGLLTARSFADGGVDTAVQLTSIFMLFDYAVSDGSCNNRESYVMTSLLGIVAFLTLTDVLPVTALSARTILINLHNLAVAFWQCNTGFPDTFAGSLSIAALSLFASTSPTATPFARSVLAKVFYRASFSGLLGDESSSVGAGWSRILAVSLVRAVSPGFTTFPSVTPRDLHMRTLVDFADNKQGTFALTLLVEINTLTILAATLHSTATVLEEISHTNLPAEFLLRQSLIRASPLTF